MDVQLVFVVCLVVHLEFVLVLLVLVQLVLLVQSRLHLQHHPQLIPFPIELIHQ